MAIIRITCIHIFFILKWLECSSHRWEGILIFDEYISFCLNTFILFCRCTWNHHVTYHYLKILNLQRKHGKETNPPLKVMQFWNASLPFQICSSMSILENFFLIVSFNFIYDTIENKDLFRHNRRGKKWYIQSSILTIAIYRNMGSLHTCAYIPVFFFLIYRAQNSTSCFFLFGQWKPMSRIK